MGISTLDRYDSRLIKVLELPYPPFTPVMSSNKITVPTGWEYDFDTGFFKLTNLNTEFLCTLPSNTLMLSNLRYTHTIHTTDSPQMSAESKLWHSDYGVSKLVYDNFQYINKLENLRATASSASIDPTMAIQYKPSNTISGNGAFKLTSSGLSSDLKEGDFEEYLIYSRDNDIPLYTSEWLNYLKYGKQYDEKANALSVAKAGTSLAGSIAGGAIAGFMAPVPKIAGTIAGAVVGAIVGSITLGVTTAQTINAQEQKEAQYKSQSASVSGNNDLNIFDWYSNNKLLKVDYVLPSDIRLTL